MSFDLNRFTLVEAKHSVRKNSKVKYYSAIHKNSMTSAQDLTAPPFLIKAIRITSFDDLNNINEEVTLNLKAQVAAQNEGILKLQGSKFVSTKNPNNQSEGDFYILYDPVYRNLRDEIVHRQAKLEKKLDNNSIINSNNNNDIYFSNHTLIAIITKLLNTLQKLQLDDISHRSVELESIFLAPIPSSKRTLQKTNNNNRNEFDVLLTDFSLAKNLIGQANSEVRSINMDEIRFSSYPDKEAMRAIQENRSEVMTNYFKIDTYSLGIVCAQLATLQIFPNTHTFDASFQSTFFTIEAKYGKETKELIQKMVSNRDNRPDFIDLYNQISQYVNSAQKNHRLPLQKHAAAAAGVSQQPPPNPFIQSLVQSSQGSSDPAPPPPQGNNVAFTQARSEFMREDAIKEQESDDLRDDFSDDSSDLISDSFNDRIELSFSLGEILPSNTLQESSLIEINSINNNQGFGQQREQSQQQQKFHHHQHTNTLDGVFEQAELARQTSENNINAEKKNTNNNNNNNNKISQLKKDVPLPTKLSSVNFVGPPELQHRKSNQIQISPADLRSLSDNKIPTAEKLDGILRKVSTNPGEKNPNKPYDKNLKVEISESRNPTYPHEEDYRPHSSEEGAAGEADAVAAAAGIQKLQPNQPPQSISNETVAAQEDFYKNQWMLLSASLRDSKKSELTYNELIKTVKARCLNLKWIEERTIKKESLLAETPTSTVWIMSTYAQNCCVLKQLKPRANSDVLAMLESMNHFQTVPENLLTIRTEQFHILPSANNPHQSMLIIVQKRKTFSLNRISLHATPFSKKLRIAELLISTLSKLHKQSPPIIHGAIKPSNVLLDLQLQPFYSDFGFSEIIINEAQKELNKQFLENNNSPQNNWKQQQQQKIQQQQQQQQMNQFPQTQQQQIKSSPQLPKSPNIYIKNNEKYFHSNEKNYQNHMQRSLTFASGFSAPELLKDLIVWMASDVWSLGMILYEIFFEKVTKQTIDEFAIYDSSKMGCVDLTGFNINQNLIQIAGLIKLMTQFKPENRPPIDEVETIFQEIKSNLEFEAAEKKPTNYNNINATNNAANYRYKMQQPNLQKVVSQQQFKFPQNTTTTTTTTTTNANRIQLLQPAFPQKNTSTQLKPALKSAVTSKKVIKK